MRLISDKEEISTLAMLSFSRILLETALIEEDESPDSRESISISLVGEKGKILGTMVKGYEWKPQFGHTVIGCTTLKRREDEGRRYYFDNTSFEHRPVINNALVIMNEWGDVYTDLSLKRIIKYARLLKASDFEIIKELQKKSKKNFREYTWEWWNI